MIFQIFTRLPTIAFITVSLDHYQHYTFPSNLPHLSHVLFSSKTMKTASHLLILPQTVIHCSLFKQSHKPCFNIFVWQYMFLSAVSCRLKILQLEFFFKQPKNVSVTVIFFILGRMESFFCFKTMMNKKSIAEDHKVIASNVSFADLTDSVKTILKKKTKR